MRPKNPPIPPVHRDDGCDCPPDQLRLHGCTCWQNHDEPPFEENPLDIDDDPGEAAEWHDYDPDC